MNKQKNFIAKLELIWNLNKVKIGYYLLSIVEYALIIFLALFNNRLIEVLIVIPLFYIFRDKYEKQYHAENLVKCATISVIVFAFIIYVIPSKNLSILASVFMPYFMTTISYYVKDYLDQEKLLSKKLESMTFDEMKSRFTTYTEYDLKAVYDYINRGTKLADNIAMKYNYSTRQLQRIIKKMKDELK